MQLTINATVHVHLHDHTDDGGPVVGLLETILEKVTAMSQTITDAVAALTAKIATLETDEQAELQALAGLITSNQTSAAAVADLKAQITTLQTQIANGQTVDVTPLLTRIEALDAGMLKGIADAAAAGVAAAPAPAT